MVDIVQGVKDFAKGYGASNWFDLEGKGGDILEAYLPSGRITSEGYQTPRELYGDMFVDELTTEQRRLVLKRLRDDERAEDITEEDENAWTIAGEMLGTLLKDPATLFIPAGKTVAGGVMSGFGVGAMFDLTTQLADTGTINPVQTVVAGGIGGILGGTFNGVAAKLSTLGKKTAKAASNPSTVRVSNTQIGKIEELNNKLAAAKVAPEARPAAIAEELGVEEDVVRLWVGSSSKRMDSPTTAQAKQVEELAADPQQFVKLPEIVEDVITPIRRRIERISPKIAARLQRYEAKLHLNSVNYEKRVAGFLHGFTRMSQQGKSDVALNLFNRNYKAARKAAERHGMNGEDIYQVERLLKDIYKDKAARGIDTNQMKDYFPRAVKDWESLRGTMGLEGKEIDLMRTHYAKNVFHHKRASQLTPSEDMYIIQQYMKGKATQIQGVKGSKRGKFDVREAQLAFYDDPASALTHYIRKASDDIAAADEVFGVVREVGKNKKIKRVRTKKEVVDKLDIDIDSMDVDGGIDDLLSDMLNTDPKGAEEVGALLRSRLTMTREPTNKAIANLRSLGYMNTIGNPMSALTQLTDIGISAVTNGLRPTLKALVGKKNVDMLEIGLKSALDADFATVDTLNKTLNRTLNASGFAKIDRLGKNVYINAALNKGKGMLKTPKGREAFKKKWGTMFEDDLDSLMNDLDAGDVTDRVKLMLFTELSESQPIAMSEMPKVYLDNPNGRLMYMLKTFGLKQLDLLRNNVVDNATKGNYKEAAKFASGYLGVVSLMGAGVDEVKDMFRGGTPSIEDIPDNYIDKLMAVFMTNRYMAEDILSGGVVEGVIDGMLMPPLDWIESVATDLMVNLPDALGDEARAKDIQWKTPEELPVVGFLAPRIMDLMFNQSNLLDKRTKESRERSNSASARAVRRVIQ